MATDDDRAELRRRFTLLWDNGTPNRSNKLSRPAIVDAAIALADEEGVQALSMRRVATKLGVGTMSLYRHVPNKAALLDLVLDRMCAPTDDIREITGDWRSALEAIARANWELYTTHRWLLEVNWARPALGPSSLAGTELFMRALDGLPLSSQEGVLIMVAVDTFVIGQARAYVHSHAAAEETGISDEEFWSAQVPLLEDAMATGNYPTMAALDMDAFGASWKETFEFGLARLLDGIEHLVARRQADGSA